MKFVYIYIYIYIYIERLQISVTGLARTSAPSFRNLPGSLSMPAAFEVSISPKILGT